MDNEGKAKRGTDALLALLINAVILAALLSVCRPFFETNDDTALLTLVNGSKYSADPHMVISGIWMGRLLMALYGITHALPWYTLVQYAMLLLSFTGVTYVLLRRMGRLWGTVFSIALVGWFGYSSYIVIQFSRTAGITSASAMFLLFYSATGMFPVLERAYDAKADPERDRRSRSEGKRRAQILAKSDLRLYENVTGTVRIYEREKPERHFGADRWISLILAFILSALSSWLRFTQFLPCAVLTSGIGLWMVLILISDHLHQLRLARLRNARDVTGGRERRRAGMPFVLKLMALLLPFVIAFGLCMAFRIDDKRSYRQGDVWETFREFDVRREELYDYGFPDYPTNLETYAAAGISDAGYTLYANWNFADPDRFTVEVMDSLIAVKEEKHFSKQMLKDFLKEVPAKLIMKPFVWFLLFVLAAWLLSGKPDKRAFLSVLWGLMLFTLLYLYLYYNGRYLRNRVDTALVYALILSVAWFVRPAGVRRTWWIVPVLVAAMIFVPAMKQPFRLRASSTGRVERMMKRRSRLEALSADTEHLYVMKMGSLVANDCYGPLDPMPEKVIGNLLYLGGWAAYTRAFCDTMAAYGISNPYRDLIDHEKLYLVDNDIELTMTYLRENYAPGAVYEQVGKLQKYGIYKVKSG